MSRKSLFGVLFVVAAATLGLFLSRAPWAVYQEQRAKAESATSEMRKAEEEKVGLLREKAKYETPVGREELARDRGYMKPGEQPVKPGVGR